MFDLLSLVLVLTTGTPDLTPNLTIIKDGKSDYAIVVPDNPPHPIPFAARELQHFLEEMSGVEVPIVAASQPGDGPALSKSSIDGAYHCAYNV